jgi:hypothetical protein
MNESDLPHPYDSPSHADDSTVAPSQVTIQSQVIVGQVTNAGTIYGPVVGVNTGTINYQVGVPLTETLAQLLNHHESSTVFRNRLQNFVGREAEIAEIRQRIAQVMLTGGYVTITAQAGEGKSSVIAQMVSQDGPNQTAFHFIALTPGREYQLSLLRPIVARLILKHGLPTTYFPGESYPAMRDFFHRILSQLSERGVQEVIYLDGLDQLKYETDGERDLSFLPTTPPPGIVFVLGTRPDDTLQPLQAMKPNEYCLPHLNLSDFQQLLAMHGVVTVAAQRLYDALQGNAFYLALVVQELKAGPIIDLDTFIAGISTNPDNLFGFTIARLRRDRAYWKDVLQPVLALLLVAQDPLEISTLRHLLGVEDLDLRSGLQRLGGLVAQDTEGRYFLYHLKVRDYLAEDPQQPNAPFVVSQEQIDTWHRQLAVWCVREHVDVARIWEDTTGLEQARRWYARHHYVTHLALGGLWETLSQVIDAGIYGRYKRQYDPSTRLYAQDLDHARDVAFQNDDLRALWRWSLLRVNLVSHINAWPDTLFHILCLLKQEQAALNCIELVSEPLRQIELFCQVASCISPETQHNAWARAHTIAGMLTDIHGRDDALTSIAKAQARSGLWVEAHKTIADIGLLWQRGEALVSLAQAQTQAHHPDAAATLRQAQTTIDQLHSGYSYVKLMNALALVHMQYDASAGMQTLARSQQVIEAMADTVRQRQARKDLAMVQAEAGLWTEARATLTMLPREQWSDVYRALAQAQAEAGLWDEAWDTINALSDITNDTPDDTYTDALYTIAQIQIQCGLWQDLESTISAMPTSVAQVACLIDLAKAQYEVNHNEGLVTFDRARTTIDALADPLNPEDHAQALGMLSLALVQIKHPDGLVLFEQVQQTITQRRDTVQYTRVLSALASAQVKADQPAGYSTFQRIHHELTHEPSPLSRTQALKILGEAYVEIGFWQDAYTIITALPRRMGRGEALMVLAEAQITAGAWNEAQTTIDAFHDSWAQVLTLIRLATAQMQADHPDGPATFAVASAAVHALSDWHRPEGMSYLAMAQTITGHPDGPATFALAQQIIEAIPEQARRDDERATLAQAQAKAALWSAVQTSITSITDETYRRPVLVSLAAAQAESGLWEEAQTTIALIVDRTARAEALTSLAQAQVRAGLWTEAESTIAGLTSTSQRAKTLTALAVAQAKAHHPQTLKSMERARSALVKVLDDEQYVMMLKTLVTAMIQYGAMDWVRCAIGQTWRSVHTFDEIIPRADLASPIISHNPLLGEAIINAFAWVEDQLRGV